MAPINTLGGLYLLMCIVLAEAAQFKCNSPATCNALIGYVSPDATTLAGILTIFNRSATLPALLAANGLDPSTPRTHPVAPRELLRIPFPCRCSNGTGFSDKVPVYTLVAGDTPFSIARNVYGGLVPYQDIQTVNNLDPVSLLAGQGLWIPLPCSCDDVDGNKVVHYAHLVAKYSTIEEISDQFGTTQDDLAKLNGLAGPRDLLAGSVIDVPLTACDSVIRADSPDYPLLVPNGSYALTANDCVKCNCDAADYKLKCVPSKMKPSRTWATCPSAQCSSFELGTSTVSNSSCSSSSTCSYAGYNNQTIFATFANSSCPDSGDKSWAVSIQASWKQLFPILILAQILVTVL